MKKSNVRRTMKVINGFVAIMMLLQPVGMPGILGVMSLSGTAVAETTQPATDQTAAPTDSGSTTSDKSSSDSVSADKTSTDKTPDSTATDSATTTNTTTKEATAGATSVDTSSSATDSTPTQTNNSSGVSSINNSETTSPDSANTDTAATSKNGQICVDSGAKITDSAKSDWDANGDTAETKNKVELGVKYIFPGDENVSVTFTCLPAASADRTTLKIQQIKSSDINLPAGVSAASEYAYDVTTGMKDGDFKYDLTLPKSDVDGAEVKYFEKTAKEATTTEITSAELKSVDDTKVKDEDKAVKVSELDHFTIFIATYSSSTFSTTKTIYQQGETVYANATGLTHNNSIYYRIDIINPSGTSVANSGCSRNLNSLSYTYSTTISDPIGTNWKAEITKYSSSSSCDTRNSVTDTGDVSFELDAPTIPDLTAVKTHTPTGNGFVNQPFTWSIRVQNSGSANATFASGSTILTDNLPTSGATYGLITVTKSDSTVTGTINCSISSNNLGCTASSGSVVIPAAKYFDVSFSVTPNVIGSLVNPRTGSGSPICKVDPSSTNGVVSESNETNNTCSDTVIIINDTIPPSVAINQAAGQADPVNTSPINFTATFSEPVTGFATGDVTLSGTAGATTAIVTGSGASYNVAVSGMTQPGTVIASISAGVAKDLAGNDNLVSTSTDNTVSYIDNIAPIISQVTPVPTPTGDNTPSYVFSNDEAGTVVVGGSCSIAATNAAIGNNTITFNTLAAGTYSNCTVNVVDSSGNTSNTLSIPSFTIDANMFEKGLVTFSFDDGLETTYQNIGLLQGYKSTQFVYTDTMIGATECAAEGQNCYSDFMTSAQVFDLYNAGHEISSHTRSHPDMSTITDQAQIQYEVDGSRLDLLQMIGSPVKDLAYPYGIPAAQVNLEQAGYSGARGVDSTELNSKTTDRYDLFALEVDTNISVNTVKTEIDQAIANGQWLVLVFHTISNNCPDQYCTTPSNLTAIVNYIKNKGNSLDVITMGQGLGEMDNNPVSDGIPPVITQADITQEATSSAGAAVAFSPVVTDNDAGLPATLNAYCTIPNSVQDPNTGLTFPTAIVSGHVFPIGSTVVTCTAADTGGNLATKTFTVTVADAIPPAVVFTTTATNPNNLASIPVTATFTKSVTGFDATDIVVANGTVTDFAGSGATYTFNIAPAADGTVTVNVPAGVAQDSVLNFNTAATELSFVSDRTSPVISIVQPDTKPAKSKIITASVPDGTLTMSVDAGSVCDATLAYLTYSDTTFNAEADNGKTICYRAEDSALNVSYLLSSAISGIDTTAPDAPANLVADTGSPTNSTTQNWSWNASTDLNGIVDYVFHITGGASGTDTIIPETSTENKTSILTNLLDGIYNFFVKAIDSAGNQSLESLFTITVDATPPSIASHNDESAEATSNAGAVVTYKSPATTDNFDPAGVATCLPASGSTFALGDTIVTCTAVDSNKNVAAPTTFAVHVVDTEKPVITLLGNNPMNVEVHTIYSEPGATVIDNHDTGLTAVITGSVDTETVGTYTRNYNVTDSNGNSAQEITRTINVVDTKKPVITLLGENPMTVEIYKDYTEPGATVSDNYDADLVASADASAVDTGKIGSYAVNYTAHDSSGNEADQQVRTVNVVDSTKPVVTITDGTDTIEVHSIFTDAGASWTDNYDGDGNISSATSGSVDQDTVGDYILTYSYTDANGNTGTADRIVHVVDTVAPSTPIASPDGGDYMTNQSVTLTSTDDGSGLDQIYFTTDGSHPDKTKTEYVGPITVDKDMTIKAVSYDKAGNASDVLTTVFGIAPVISEEISDSVSDTTATITWTTDNPATSRVVYDTVSHPVMDPAPNYGYANSTVEADVSPKVTSHSVILSGLTADTTYFYRVISHGSPETTGAEISFTTATTSSGSSSHHHHHSGGGGGGGNGGGGSAAAAGVSTALAAGGAATGGIVAGEGQQNVSADKPASQETAQQGQVLGEQSNNENKPSGFMSHPYLYTLLAIVVLGFVYFFTRKYRLNKKEENTNN